MSDSSEKRTESGRRWAVRSLIEPAERFPNLHPPRLDSSGLTPADAALGLAIYRTTIQRWLTLEYLLDLHLKGKLRRLDPIVQSVLLSGAAQLLFMDRLPGYAVVDQAVGLVRGFASKQHTGLVNAVLRKVAGMIGKPDSNATYTPAADALPLSGGGVVKLNQPCLPPVDQIEWHTSIATSTPRPLIKSWAERYGDEQAGTIALQSIENPPTIVVAEPGFVAEGFAEHLKPHQRSGFYLWTGPYEAMREFLSGHRLRRVQDPAATLAVDATADLEPTTILDYCAGRGTKSRQLAAAHPSATVHATDVDQSRLADLREVAEGYDNLHVIEPGEAGGRVYDLILLDVPCSNTGVLARRPEARYRYSQQTLAEVIHLQRSIVDQAAAWLNPEGSHLLYSTCSIEPPENAKQVQRFIRQWQGGSAEVVEENQQLPSGSGDTYIDGSYHALVRCVGAK